MLKKIRDFRSSLNGFHFERGKKAVKWKKKSFSKHNFLPIMVEKQGCYSPTTSALASLLPKFPFTTNKNPACILNYLQLPNQFSLSLPRHFTKSRPHTASAKTKEKPAVSWRPSSAFNALTVQTRGYTNKFPSYQPGESKRNDKLVSDETYLKSLKTNIRGIVEKQLDHIKDVQNKRVKKNISSAVSLQKLVVDRIREQYNPGPSIGRDYEMQGINKSKKTINSTRGLEKNESVSKNPLESTPQSAILSHSLGLSNCKDHSKIRNDTLSTSYFYGNNESSLAKNGKIYSTLQRLSNRDKSTSYKSVQKFPKTYFQTKLVDQHIQDEKHYTMTDHVTGQTNSTNESMLPPKENTDQGTDKRTILQQWQFTGEQNVSKKKPSHQANDIIKSNETQEKSPIKLNPSLYAYSPFSASKRNPSLKAKVDSDQSKEYAVNKALEEIASTGDSNALRRRKDAALIPRDRKPRQMPNFVRNNNQLEFSHKSLYIKDSDLYKKFRILEREKRLKSIYNTHWAYKMPTDMVQRVASVAKPNIRKPLVKPTRPLVVHKLNASNIAERIKLKAKIINKNKMKDELLQPQIYCRKSMVLGLAQMPIMPCKNSILRNETLDSLKNKRPVFSKTTPKTPKNSKLYTQAMKQSRPVWANQKMMTTDKSYSNLEQKSTKPKSRKMDFKGTLRYIMNLKSRLQNQ